MNKKHFVLGGDIKKSLNEGYRFNFKVLFKDAFKITRKNYLPLIVACLFTATIVLSGYGLGAEQLASYPEHVQLAISFIFSSFVMTPLVTGLTMMGINHSVGLKTKSIDVFNPFNIILKLALANMIISLGVLGISTLFDAVLGDIGNSLSLVLMLYVNVAFCLAYPLIAEKKVAPQLALKLSFLIVNKNLIQFTLLFMLITLLAVVAVIPSGLGLFLFFPFYFNLLGVVYREICGVGLIAIETGTPANPAEGENESLNSDVTNTSTNKNTENDQPQTPPDYPVENEEQMKPDSKVNQNTDKKPTSPASDKFEA